MDDGGEFGGRPLGFKVVVDAVTSQDMRVCKAKFQSNFKGRNCFKLICFQACGVSEEF